MGTTTSRSGAALRVTVTVTVSPSSTGYVAESKLTVTLGTSSSLMETVVSGTLPLDTPAGRALPKVSLTLSPSSSTVSWVAVKVKVFSMSVGPRDAGLRE